MPIMQVFMVEGRTEQQKSDFIAAVTEAAVNSLKVPPESVRIMITDMPKANFGVAGHPYGSRLK